MCHTFIVLTFSCFWCSLSSNSDSNEHYTKSDACCFLSLFLGSHAPLIDEKREGREEKRRRRKKEKETSAEALERKNDTSPRILYYYDEDLYYLPLPPPLLLLAPSLREASHQTATLSIKNRDDVSYFYRPPPLLLLALSLRVASHQTATLSIKNRDAVSYFYRLEILVFFHVASSWVTCSFSSDSDTLNHKWRWGVILLSS